MRTLGKDIAWNKINGKFCHVFSFTHHASVRNREIESTGVSIPYATLTLECEEVSEHIECPIIHKLDFVHLWKIFKERGGREDEEVLVSRYKYITVLGKLFSPFLPKIHIWIYKKGSYNNFTSKSWQEKTHAEELAMAARPIVEVNPFPDNRFLQ
ncbi:MAG: hypothetical protein UT17_C0017G0010 [Candidatus Woesebacteria bacterium GW2011_GWB1_39_10]|uniref:Uncharacterized protein n=1 Tax=Candidatus Woesebacteria bacterium GW2011_GWB1_39_10 TaxID=1618572 RepID=A0A0G0LJF0_9BACT|nr:MAG: hypothetical protein UT17_C0017G0010 [Candidatus Woesebacteria bacterium GW2011_GWB1_39_10]